MMDGRWVAREKRKAEENNDQRSKALQKFGTTTLIPRLQQQKNRVNDHPATEDVLGKIMERTERMEHEMRKQNSGISNMRQGEMKTLHSVQERLQLLETEFVKLKLDSSAKPTAYGPADNHSNLLAYLRRVEESNKEMQKYIHSMDVRMVETQQQLKVLSDRAEQKVQLTKYDVQQLREESQLSQASTYTRSAGVEQQMSRLQTKTLEMEKQLRDLLSNVDSLRLHSTTQTKEIENRTQQTMERLNNLNKMLSQKETQLKERISDVQESIQTIEAFTRDAGERRVHMLEMQNEFARDATNRRVGITENALGRERRDRLASEAQLRREIEMKWESLESSLREHETILKSANERFIHQTNNMMGNQVARMEQLEEKVAKRLASLQNAMNNTNTLMSKVQQEAQSAVKAATKKTEEILRAEIKVRAAAMSKVYETMNEHQAKAEKETAAIVARSEARADLMNTKIQNLHEALEDQNTQLCRQIETVFQKLESSQKAFEAAISERCDSAFANIQQLSDHMKEGFARLEQQTKQVQEESLTRANEIETKARERHEESEHRMKTALLEAKDSLSKAIVKERIERVEELAALKRYMEGRFTHMDENWKTNHQVLDNDLKAVKKQTDIELSRVENTCRTLVHDTEQSLASQMQASRKAADMQTESLKEQISSGIRDVKADQQHLAEVQDELQSSLAQVTETLRTDLRKRSTALEARDNELDRRLDHMHSAILDEKGRAERKELALETKVRESAQQAETKLEEAITETTQAWDKSITQVQSTLQSYVDNKLTVLRSVLKTSVQAEAATRVENIRWTREDLERLMAIQEQLQQRFTVEQFKVLYGKMELLLSDERSQRKEGDSTLRVELKQEIDQVQSLLREEAELRAMLDNLCAQVEKEAEQAHIHELDRRQDSQERALLRESDERKAALVRLEGDTSEKMSQLEGKVNSSLSKLQTSTNEQVEKLAVQQQIAAMASETTQTELERRFEAHREEAAEKLSSETSKLEEKVLSQQAKLQTVEKRHAEALSAVQAKQTAMEASLEASSCLERLVTSVSLEEERREVQVIKDKLEGVINSLTQMKSSTPNIDSLRHELSLLLKTQEKMGGQHEALVAKLEESTGGGSKAEVLDQVRTDVEQHSKALEAVQKNLKNLEDLVILIGQNDLKENRDIEAVRKSIANLKAAGSKMQQDMVFFANEGLKEKRQRIDLDEKLDKLQEDTEVQFEKLQEKDNKIQDDMIFFAGQNLEEKKRQIDLEEKVDDDAQAITDLKEKDNKIQDDMIFFAGQNLEEKKRQIDLEEKVNEKL